MKEVVSLENIDRQQFEKSFLKKQLPVVITHGINEWPIRHWTSQKLCTLYNDKKVDFRFQPICHERKQINQTIQLGDLIRLCFAMKANRQNLPQSTFKVFPEVTNEFSLPSWADRAKTYQTEFSIEQKSTIMPLHWEPKHFYIAQIIGNKTFYLFSPRQSQYLAPSYDRVLYNYSYISNIEKVDQSKFPLFAQTRPLQINLQPGQVLFIPAGWWVQSKSEASSLSINFTWAPQLNECKPNHILKRRLVQQFNSKIFDFSDWLDLSNFQNDLEIAQFLLEKNCFWATIIFCAIHAKKNLTDYSSDNYLNNLLYLAADEDNELFKEISLLNFIEELKSTPNKMVQL